MSEERCQSERIRLKNEISFARGSALWGGPSSEAMIATLKATVDMIDKRLGEMSDLADRRVRHSPTKSSFIQYAI